jgi:hypothetical protein
MSHRVAEGSAAHIRRAPKNYKLTLLIILESAV